MEAMSRRSGEASSPCADDSPSLEPPRSRGLLVGENCSLSLSYSMIARVVFNCERVPGEFASWNKMTGCLLVVLNLIVNDSTPRRIIKIPYRTLQYLVVKK